MTDEIQENEIAFIFKGTDLKEELSEEEEEFAKMELSLKRRKTNPQGKLDLTSLSKDMVKALEHWYQDIMIQPFLNMLKKDPRDEKTLTKQEVFKKFISTF